MCIFLNFKAELLKRGKVPKNRQKPTDNEKRNFIKAALYAGLLWTTCGRSLIVVNTQENGPELKLDVDNGKPCLQED